MNRGIAIHAQSPELCLYPLACGKELCLYAAFADAHSFGNLSHAHLIVVKKYYNGAQVGAQAVYNVFYLALYLFILHIVLGDHNRLVEKAVFYRVIAVVVVIEAHGIIAAAKLIGAEIICNAVYPACKAIV